MVKLFGTPDIDYEGDGKIAVDWVLEDQFGNVVHLYDYKSNEYGLTVEKLKKMMSYSWHIGVNEKGIREGVADDLKKYIYTH